MQTPPPVSASLQTLLSSSNRARPLSAPGQPSAESQAPPSPSVSPPLLGSIHSRPRPPDFSRNYPFGFEGSALTSSSPPASPHLRRGSTPISPSDPSSVHNAPPTLFPSRPRPICAHHGPPTSSHHAPPTSFPPRPRPICVHQGTPTSSQHAPPSHLSPGPAPLRTAVGGGAHGCARGSRGRPLLGGGGPLLPLPWKQPGVGAN